MALDQAYFDAIDIEIVKKKYYNANKVEAVFEDIRRRARELTEENERMRRQLALLTGQKDEIGETLLSAKSIAQNMLREAQAGPRRSSPRPRRAPAKRRPPRRARRSPSDGSRPATAACASSSSAAWTS